MSQNEESCSSTSNAGESRLSSFQQITPPRENGQGKNYNCGEGIRELQFTERALTPPPETSDQQNALLSFLSIQPNTSFEAANPNRAVPESSFRKRRATKDKEGEASTPEKCSRSTSTADNIGDKKVDVHNANGVVIVGNGATVTVTHNHFLNGISVREPIPQETNIASPESNSNTSTHQEKCKQCLAQNPNMQFLPCGHCCVCNHCVKSIKTCPLCGSNIATAVLDYTA